MQVHRQNLNELAHISFLNNTPFAIIKRRRVRRQLAGDVEYSGGKPPFFRVLIRRCSNKRDLPSPDALSARV